MKFLVINIIFDNIFDKKINDKLINEVGLKKIKNPIL